MENNTATVNNTTPAVNNQRRREHGNFGSRKVVRDLADLDPSQFPPAKPREERVPMWAQELAAQITLLSQEQQKVVNQLDALIMLQADSSSEEDLKSSIEAGFSKVRENQNNSYEELMKKIDFATEETVKSCQALFKLHGNMKGSVMDICGMLQNIQQELQTKAAKRWKNPITAIKQLLEKTGEERRKNKAAKLEEQLRKLRADQ